MQKRFAQVLCIKIVQKLRVDSLGAGGQAAGLGGDVGSYGLQNAATPLAIRRGWLPSGWIATMFTEPSEATTGRAIAELSGAQSRWLRPYCSNSGITCDT